MGAGAAHLFVEIDQPDTNLILRLWDTATGQTTRTLPGMGPKKESLILKAIEERQGRAVLVTDQGVAGQSEVVDEHLEAAEAERESPLWLRAMSFVGGSGSHAFYFLDPDGNRIEIMDKTGYEAVWLAEHHFSNYGMSPAPAEEGYDVSHGSAIYVYDPQGRLRLLINNTDRTVGAMVADVRLLLNE